MSSEAPPGPEQAGPRAKPRSAVRRAVSWLVLLVCTLLVAAWVYGRRDDLSVLRDMNPAFLVGLIALQLLYLVLQGARQQLVLEKCAERRIAFLPWFRLYVIGRFLNLFVPQAGNIYRGLELKRHYDITLTRYAASLFSSVWIVTVFTMAFGTIFVALLDSQLMLGRVPAVAVLTALTIAAGVMPPIATFILERVEIGFAGAAWLHQRFSELLRVTVQSLGDTGYIVRVLLWTVATFAQASLMFWGCFKSIGISVPFSEVVVFYVILQTTTHVALTPGNLGVQEVAFGLLAESTGLGAVEGVIVSGLLRATGWVAMLALAVPMGGLRTIRTMKASHGAPDAAS